VPRAPRTGVGQADRLLPGRGDPDRGPVALIEEAKIKDQLRGWILDRTTSGATELEDDTPILDSGLLSSLDVVELIVFIESLKGEEVDVDAIEPESLENLDVLYRAFFVEG
jgi:hypothetical protein